MLNKIFTWLKNNDLQLSWFIIGFLTFATLDALSRGNYIVAAVDAVLVALNYWLRSKSV